MRILILLLLTSIQPIYGMAKKHPSLPESFYLLKGKKLVKKCASNSPLFNIRLINYLEHIIDECKKVITKEKTPESICNLIDPGLIWKKNHPFDQKSYDYFRFKFAELGLRFLMFGIRNNLKCYFGKLTKEEQSLHLIQRTEKAFLELMEKQYQTQTDYENAHLMEIEKLAKTIIYLLEQHNIQITQK